MSAALALVTIFSSTILSSCCAASGAPARQARRRKERYGQKPAAVRRAGERLGWVGEAVMVPGIEMALVNGARTARTASDHEHGLCQIVYNAVSYPTPSPSACMQLWGGMDSTQHGTQHHPDPFTAPADAAGSQPGGT